MIFIINIFSDKLTKWLINMNLLHNDKYSDFDYYVRYYFFILLNVTSLLTINYYLNSIFEVIILGIVFNVLRLYVDGFHCEKLENCIIVTSLSFSLFAWLSKVSVVYSNLIFFVGMIIGVWIIKHIMWNVDKNDDDKLHYNISHYINWLLLFLVIGSVCLYFGFDMVSNSISFGIFLVGLLLRWK